MSLSIHKRALLGCSAICAIAMSEPGFAADNEPPETVVITGTLFNPEVAPAKASIDTTEPHTIIGRTYIEDSTSPTADYVTILGIVPSLTGQDVNGPGLSEGNVKNTLRGLPDGNFGMTFDGIPFGDTNGPTHHSSSYFPASTIGSIEVERGPGSASTLGPSTYGGSINLYSEPLADDFRTHGSISGGSFNTYHSDLNVQSGDIAALNNTKILFNYDWLQSDGALTLQRIRHYNDLVKVEAPIAGSWTLTLLGNWSHLYLNQSDSNGATPAQIATFGKDFALQSTNINLPTYYQYGVTEKYTDMDYARLKGDLFPGFHFEDQGYTYAYVNKTFSARNIGQTLNDINNGTAEGMGGKNSPIVNGVKFASDIPGYQKLNAYRVWGNVVRGTQDYDFGQVKGQLRFGVWWESAATQRARFDFDMTKCFAAGINPWYENGSSCQDSSLAAQGKAVLLTNQGNPRYNGYAEFLEHSGWDQYEPFAEIEINPIEDLKVTPGVKYVDWLLKTDAPLEPKLLKPFKGSFRTTDTLPFLTANYKIMPNWSVYGQYAKGIYVPDITAFQQKTTVFTFPKAQTTTNYQLGTVYYADNYTFDADVYYIPVNNNIVFVNCNTVGGPSGETCGVNTGKATYKGIEAEGTYAFNNDMDGMLRGLVVFINGSINSAKSGGLYLQQAPMWTAATGLIYKREGWKFSVTDKMVGPQYSDNVQDTNYRIHTYNNMDVTLGYEFGRFELDAGVYNALNSRSVLAIKENDGTNGLSAAAFAANRMASVDQYYFQPVRSFMVTLKANWSPGMN